MSLNPDLINIDASHYSGDKFTSTVNPNSVNVNALPLPGSNVQSAASYFPCTVQSGGKRTKINRRKINKISRMYKMKSKRHIKRMKSRLRSTFRSKKHASRRHSRVKRHGKRRGQRGGDGYSQFQNNTPMTQTYSLGGQLSASSSALASPPPYQVLSNCTNCVDNYNHFTNSGFPSRGSY